MEEQKKDEKVSYTSIQPKKPEGPKPATTVATGKVRKKGLGEKFAETFLATDLKSVANSIIFDTLIPSIKNAIDDIIENSKNMMLYGDVRGRHTEQRNRQGVVRTSYDRFFDERNGTRIVSDSRQPLQPKPRNLIDDIVFDTRAKGEDVLANLRSDLREYNMVSVMRLYQYAGISSNYAQDKYGWYNLDEARVLRVRDGFLLELPRPQVLD